jgi:hypothetical protein
MWDTYVEPNLPPEVDPGQEQAEAETNAMLAAIMAGVDLAELQQALKREHRP